jgi:hypothetical protein
MESTVGGKKFKEKHHISGPVPFPCLWWCNTLEEAVDEVVDAIINEMNAYLGVPRSWLKDKQGLL